MLFRPYEWAAEAHTKLVKARIELCRKHPDLGREAMKLVLIHSDFMVKYTRNYPNSYFATDGAEVVYKPDWINRRTQDELVFVWAQTAIMKRDRLAADMGLSGRNRHWQNMAIDYVVNAQLVRDGIGTIPTEALHLPGITPDMDTDLAYDIVRGMAEIQATVRDERGKDHLLYEDITADQEARERQNPLCEPVYGLLERIVTCPRQPVALDQ
jgi:hypothetical protein